MYYNKYLKYKNKYINYKKYGGANNVMDAILTRRVVDDKKSLIELYYDNYFNDPITELSSSLEKLHFGFSFNQSPVFLSELINLTELKFGERFNYALDLENLKQLRILHLGSNFNQRITNLPSSLVELKLGNAFQRNITLKGLKNLQELELGNASIDVNDFMNLNELRKLKLGKLFNFGKTDNIDLSKLETLKELELGLDLNNESKIIIILPVNLEILHFGYYFNKKLYINEIKKIEKADGEQLPVQLSKLEQLKELRLGHMFNQPISLPLSLVTLHLGHMFDQPISLPLSLVTLHLSYMFNKTISLPLSLVTLHVGYSFNKTLIFTDKSKLEELTFDSNSMFTNNIVFPLSLKKLHFGKHFGKVSDNQFSKHFGETLNLTNVNNLEELIFDSNSLFTNGIELPPSLKKLQFGKYFNQPLDLINVNLEELIFDSNSLFNNPIELPQSLKKLHFGEYFNQSLDLTNVLQLVVLKFSNNKVFTNTIKLSSSSRHDKLFNSITDNIKDKIKRE